MLQINPQTEVIAHVPQDRIYTSNSIYSGIVHDNRVHTRNGITVCLVPLMDNAHINYNKRFKRMSKEPMNKFIAYCRWTKQHKKFNKKRDKRKFLLQRVIFTMIETSQERLALLPNIVDLTNHLEMQAVLRKKIALRAQIATLNTQLKA